MCQCGRVSGGIPGASVPNSGQTMGAGSTGGSDFDSQLAKLKAMQDMAIARNFAVQEREVLFTTANRVAQSRVTA
jgi:hypothetical protein